MTQVEGRQEDILVRQGHEDGPVDRRISFKGGRVGLNGRSRVVPRDGERRIRQIELRDPGDKSRGPEGGGVGHIRIVRAHELARVFPVEEDLATGEGERDGPVLRDPGPAILVDDGGIPASIFVRHRGVVERSGAGIVDELPEPSPVGIDARRVGLIQHPQGREVLPRQARLIGGAPADVRGQQGPRPRLRDRHLEPFGHGEQPIELAHDHLLPRLGRDGLQEQLPGFAGVQMVDVPIHPRFAPAGQFLGEIEKLPHGGEGVIIVALQRCRRAQHVADHGGMTDFLLRHELDQEPVLRGDAGLLEFFHRELGQAMMEEIELDPFHILGKRLHRIRPVSHRFREVTHQRLKVIVTLHVIYRLGSIGP